MTGPTGARAPSDLSAGWAPASRGTAAEARVSLRDVELRYADVPVAAHLSFDVKPGEFVSLIGPSGCGKSTVLRAIGGLLPVGEGTLLLDGEQVTGPRPKDVAWVFQDLALYPWRSALRNVEVALEFSKQPKRQRRDKAMAALRDVGLGDVPQRFPHQLSGGMRQRVAIARALVSEAPVLLLDEPFAALDELSRLQIGKQLVTLLEEHGKTVIFVTHSLSEAAYLSDRIVVMSPRPGTIKEIIDVALPRPRDAAVLRTPEFHRLTDRLSALLLEDAEQWGRR